MANILKSKGALKGLLRPAGFWLAGIHLFFIVSVATYLHDWMFSKPVFMPITLATEYYSAITFNNRKFGFFAPQVTSDWEAKLILTSDSGSQRSMDFDYENREMQVRIYSMIGHFQESSDTMDLFARSWALKVMNEFPEVRRVDLIITQHNLPTMANWRRGQRITDDFVYSTTFEAR